MKSQLSQIKVGDSTVVPRSIIIVEHYILKLSKKKQDKDIQEGIFALQKIKKSEK